MLFGDAFGGLDAIEDGHVDVHQEDIGQRLAGAELGQEVFAVDGFEDHLEGRVAVDEGAQGPQEKHMIIGDAYGDRHSCKFWVGMRMFTVVPFSGTDVHSMEPLSSWVR